MGFFQQKLLKRSRGKTHARTLQDEALHPSGYIHQLEWITVKVENDRGGQQNT
jgi:hypothetical protein